IYELKKIGINVYPNKFEKKESIKECLAKKIGRGEPTAGRVIAKRDIGGIIFSDLRDFSGEIQIVLNRQKIGEKDFSFFNDFIDIGDIIGIDGRLIKTKTGQKSILVKKTTIISKSTRPLPSKWYGLQDKEERYRKRYLDLIMNPHVRYVFEKRAKILKIMREFMEENDFIEVETPLLQSVYGGAMAKPFKTHIDAYDEDVFLSIAPELPLKKCLVGGFERVFEITKKFRNEGVDRNHNPEHMTLEWYQAYADYEEGMRLFEELMKRISKEIFGKFVFEYQGNRIDISKWTKITLADAIKKYLKEDVSKVKSDYDAKELAKKYNIDTKNVSKSNIQDELMKLFREKLIQPTFLIDYPIEFSPLAKPKEKNKGVAEVFQPFVGGLELARGYSELNDPELQEENFRKQEEERKAGNMEAMPTDKDFITALEYGMPNACGVGIGIERVVMLFTDNSSIRDVILFPFMKPLDE
ncbi:MAG: lysine--tRNA ligase, partial [Candidatus Pacearchaeota archaeon]